MMAIRLFILLLLLFLLLLLLLLLLVFYNSVEADDRLIQTQCHNANAPKTCIQCLTSDNRSLNADKFAIATIIVECVGKHADNLAGNMSFLARGLPKKDASRKAYEDCAVLFSRAKMELNSAAKEIKEADYDGADRYVFNARKCNFECNLKFGKGKSNISKPPFGVDSEMIAFEELSEAAMRIIERF